MRVLILQGSPRASGNTARLAAAFARGAAEQEHQVTEIFLKDKEIGDCLGCIACRKNGGRCIQADGMREIYAAMLESDVIALACPVYFYTWPSIMKRALDRTFAIEKALQNKIFYLLATGAAREERGLEFLLESFRLYVSSFDGSRIGGYVPACNTRSPEDIEKGFYLERAYRLGKEV